MNTKFDFLGEIQGAGLLPPIDIIDDGEIHRFKSSAKSKNKNG